MGFKKKGLKKVLPFVLFALLAFILSGLIYINYPLPIHSDSWMHLRFAQEIIETGSFPIKIATAEYPSLFHGILAFFLLIGVNPIAIGITYPTIAAFLVSAMTFLFVKRFFSETAALFAGVTVLLIKNSVMFLGYWFLVPVALSFAFFLATLYFFLETLSRNNLRSFILFIFFLALLGLIYPYAGLIFIPISFIYALLNFKQFLSSKPLLGFYAAVFLSFIASFFVFPAIPEIILRGFQLSQGFLFRVDFLSFVSIPFSALALIGAARFREKKEILFFSIAVLFLLLLALIWELTGVSYLIAYKRIPLFVAFFSLILAAIGLEKLYFHSLNLKFPHIKQISQIAVVVFLGISFAVLPFTFVDSLSKNIELNELPAMNWLKQNTPSNAIILSNSFEGNPIKILSGRQPYIWEPQVFGNKEVKAINSFLNGDCNAGKAFIKNVDFVYANNLLDCPFLKPEFSNSKNSFVYSIKKESLQ